MSPEQHRRGAGLVTRVVYVIESRTTWLDTSENYLTTHKRS
jgi:hypothetical protein